MDTFFMVIFSWLVVGLITYFLLSTVMGPITRVEPALKWANEWVNELLVWLRRDATFASRLNDILIKTLNDAAVKISEKDQCELVHFESMVRFSNDSSTDTAPMMLQDIRTEQGANGHLSIHGQLSAPFGVNLIMTTTSTTHEVSITQLKGEIEARLAHIGDELFFMACFSARPEMIINVCPSTTALEDYIRKCFTSMVLNFNIGELLYAPSDSSFRGSNARLSADMRNFNFLNEPPPPINMSKEVEEQDGDDALNVLLPPPNRLQLTLVKGQQMGFKHTDAYLSVEMDEPAQRFLSGRVNSSVNNVLQWDERFEFDLTATSSEILFELYEEAISLRPHAMLRRSLKQSSPPPPPRKRFIGMAILGLNELRLHRPQVQHLQLQARPYKREVEQEQEEEEDGPIGGELIVECRFFHQPLGVRSVNQRVSPVYKTQSHMHDLSLLGEEEPRHGNHFDKANNGNDHHDYPKPHNATLSYTAAPSNDEGHTPPPPVPPHHHYHYHHQTTNDPYVQSLQGELDQQMVDQRGRSREPKQSNIKKEQRSFFDELKLRLSRGSSRLRGKRARSLDEHNDGVDSDMEVEAVETAVSVPPSRDHSQIRQIRFPEAISLTGSSASARTWRDHPDSVLVLELDGQNSDEKRYYEVPPTLAADPAVIRLLRCGKKLHLHNDHSFVAVKSRGRVVCNVCGRKIPSGSFQRQAYQCRDCRKITHKSCHQRTSSPCRDSNLHNLKIVQNVDWTDFLQRNRVGEYISADGL